MRIYLILKSAPIAARYCTRQLIFNLSVFAPGVARDFSGTRVGETFTTRTPSSEKGAGLPDDLFAVARSARYLALPIAGEAIFFFCNIPGILACLAVPVFIEFCKPRHGRTENKRQHQN